MDGLQALALSKKYTGDTAEQFGAVKGAPCQVSGYVINSDGDTEITLTWKNNSNVTQTTKVVVKSGKDGADGADGDTPTASVSKSGTTSTITITDKNGTTTTTVSDGAKGDNGYSFTNAYFNSDGKLVLVLENGYELPPLTMPLAKVDISSQTGNSIVQKMDGLYVPEVDETKFALKTEVQGKADKTELSGYVEKVSGKDLVSTQDIAKIGDNSNAIGNMNTLIFTAADIVTALNGLYNGFMNKLEYTTEEGKKILRITYRNGGHSDVDVSSIITDTNVGELSNVDTTGVTDGQVLSYDNATSKFKPHTVDLAGTLSSAKTYTDEQIAATQAAIAIACDEKPIYDAQGDVTYTQDGVSKTIHEPASWFYYKDNEGISYQTRWIEGVEFTITIGTIDLSAYVNKTADVVSTYTETVGDNTKIPNLAYIVGFKSAIVGLLANKLNVSDVINTLTSSETTKPLSAAQGKALKDSVDNKVDKVTGKGLSTNDYNATEKAEVAKVKNKLDSNKVVSSFSATTLDTNVPSEKLVKTNLDTINGVFSKNIEYLAPEDINYFDFSNTVKRSGTVIVNGTSVRVYSAAASSYISSYTPMTNLIVGAKYKISADVVVTSGVGRLSVRNSSDRVIYGSDMITESGSYELDFICDDSTYFISFFATWSTKATGDVTYNNVKLDLIIPSNSELGRETVKKSFATSQTIASTGTNVTNPLTLTSASSSGDTWIAMRNNFDTEKYLGSFGFDSNSNPKVYANSKATNIVIGDFSTPSFEVPRGGTYTVNYVKKQGLGSIAIYVGNFTFGSDASGGNEYINLDGLSKDSGYKIMGEWYISDTELNGRFISYGNTSLWMQKGNTTSDTRLSSAEAAGKTVTFQITAFKP